MSISARWKKRAFPDPIFYDVQFVNPQVGWIVGELGTILRTTDGGATWTSHGPSLLGKEIVDVLALPTFFGVHFVDERVGVAAGLEGKIIRTHDGGRHWALEAIDENVGVADPLYAPLLFTDGTGWTVGSGGEVLRIEPGATAWKRAALGMHLFTWLRGIGFFDQNHGWIVGGFGTILRTQDGGRTWTPSLDHVAQDQVGRLSTTC